MSKIKMLVLDENDEFRSSLEQYALTVPVLELLGVETDLEAVIRPSTGLAPDIIVYASALLKSYGDNLLGELRNKWPDALCYRLTIFDDPVYDDYASAQGFDGSVPRSQFEHHLNAIIEAILASREELSD